MDYIEIDGVKYKVDPNDNKKALLDDKGEKVPYEDKDDDKDDNKDDDKNNKDDDKDDDKTKDNKDDLSKLSIEDLKKQHPDVAKLAKDKEDLNKTIKDKETQEEEAERKKKEDEGKWQELAETEKQKRIDIESQATKSKEVLEKYKTTVNGMLKETMKSIPEEKQNLIPSDYSPRKKLEYINNNAKTLGVNIAGAKGSKVPPNDENINLDEESKIQKEYDELLKKGKDRTQVETSKMLELAKKLKDKKKEKTDKK